MKSHFRQRQSGSPLGVLLARFGCSPQGTPRPAQPTVRGESTGSWGFEDQTPPNSGRELPRPRRRAMAARLEGGRAGRRRRFQVASFAAGRGPKKGQPRPPRYRGQAARKKTRHAAGATSTWWRRKREGLAARIPFKLVEEKRAYFYARGQPPTDKAMVAVVSSPTHPLPAGRATVRTAHLILVCELATRKIVPSTFSGIVLPAQEPPRPRSTRSSR